MVLTKDQENHLREEHQRRMQESVVGMVSQFRLLMNNAKNNIEVLINQAHNL